jgi:hypothetical protein
VQLTNYNLNSSSSTNHLRIGPFGQAFALSSYPSGTGHVWVVDRFTALIKYAIDGTEVLRIPFSTIPGLSQLIHVSTDTSDGSAWIGDDGGGRIAKYSAAGNFILGVAFSQNALEADPFDGGAWVGSGTGLVKLSPTGVQEWSRTNGAVESIVLQTQSSQYKTIYVDKSGNDTSGNGSASNAYLTIGKGISVANEGDKIIVGAGTYNENISLKSGISIIGAGSSVTTIQGLGSSNVIDGAGAQNVTIAGFTITGAGNTYTASDIYCANCNGLIIRECSIVNNGNSTTSTGISLSGATSNALIERNIITGHGGYGLLIYGYTMIRNNIIAHNNDSGIVINGAQKSYIINNVIDSNGKVVGGLSGMMISGGNHVIKNNIISNNGTNNPNPGVSVGIYVGSGTPSLSYNNVYNNYQGAYTGVTAGTGDIASNPSYVNSASGDYHLQSGSPSINTGDPTLHDAGVPCSTIPATRSDMGAYGGPWGNW